MEGDDNIQSCASLLPDNITNFVSKKMSKEQITIDTIDNFCKQHYISHIHFLKIDIEGGELDCLRGAYQMIEHNQIDIIQVEHNRCAIASRTFLRDYRDMFSKNYEMCRPLSNNR
jgi:FkbM family methyltransferase